MKILYGLTLNTGTNLREPLESRLKEDLQTVCRYRKDGIYQYAKEQDDILIILEENLQRNNPYGPEEIIQLTDVGRNHRILFLLDKNHHGDEYVKLLYACGIYDALFMDDVTPETLLKLILQERNSEEARAYYGIQVLRDVEKAEQIVNTDCLNDYMEFMEAGRMPQDIDSRYRFVTTRLGLEENRVMATNIPQTLTRILQGNEIYQYYTQNKKTRRIFSSKKNAMKRDVGTVTETAQQTEKEEKQVYYEQEKIIKGSKKILEEDMFEIMERYRILNQSEDTVKKGDIFEDMRIQMGLYLRELDI